MENVGWGNPIGLGLFFAGMGIWLWGLSNWMRPKPPRP